MAYTDIDKPSDYFNTKLYTGNGGTQSITGVGFAPNWVWIKDRGDTGYHQVLDTVRGATKYISTNTDSVEATEAAGLTSFNSDGFSLGNNTNYNSGDPRTYVSWNWKAGTSVSGTTTGSGTGKAYTGSVNTDAGFSIIRHLGNDTAGHTIPHHLGAVPKMIIGHGVSGSDATSWTVYHHTLGNTHTISLNETGAAVDSAVWNDTTPTSSVISLGSSGNVNDADDAFILYSFAEKQGYSKISSYIGNGNADGTFVYTGFKPAFVIRKVTDASSDWIMQDNKRSESGGSNQIRNYLFPNSNQAEVSNQDYFNIDFLSNGFKMRSTDGGANGSGNNYIYIAFAENPFVTSTGVPATAR